MVLKCRVVRPALNTYSEILRPRNRLMAGMVLLFMVFLAIFCVIIVIYMRGSRADREYDEEVLETLWKEDVEDIDP